MAGPGSVAAALGCAGLDRACFPAARATRVGSLLAGAPAGVGQQGLDRAGSMASLVVSGGIGTGRGGRQDKSSLRYPIRQEAAV